MSLIKRKPIIISTILFSAIMIGLSISIYYYKSVTASKELPLQQFESSTLSKKDVGEYISNNHKYWNDELCWGRSKDFSFDLYEKSYKDYIEELNKVIVAISNQDLKNDFTQAQNLLEKAQQTKNVTYLIDVHRIFHDLDVKYNQYAASDYFGITAYGKSH